MMPRRERILFVELWRLGDAVAATAGLRALRLARPDAEIAVLAHSRHGDPLFRSTDTNHQLRFDAFWTRGQLPRDKYLPWTIDYSELYRAARSIRAFRPDHVLLFRGDIREQAMFQALLARNIVDLRGPLPILPGVRTTLRPTGVPRWQEYVFHIQEWTRTSVCAEPTIAGVHRETSVPRYILLNPGASWRYKQWSAKNVVALIRWLEARGYALKIAAGAGDRQFVGAIGAAHGEKLDVKYPSLDELYAMIAGAQAVICNNSAALHIAEALDTPCIALTGPSDPIRWGTYRTHSRTLVRSTHLPCHPCGEKRCVLPSTPCIDRIALSDVIEAVDALELRGSARLSAPASF
jgi:ADP-heptose:LPS heptosyltransferase